MDGEPGGLPAPVGNRAALQGVRIETDAVVYLDPATIVSVGDNTEPKATIICTSDGKQVVTRQKSASEIIGDIQSALAD